MPAVASSASPIVSTPTHQAPNLALARSAAASPLPRAHGRADPLPASRWSTASLNDRVRALCAGKTPQMLARLTGANADAVRRYLRGTGIPPAFLVRLARSMGVSMNWLLSGRGPIRRAEVVSLALERASTADLFSELSRRLSASDAVRAASA
ncbi:MAG: helix-turn-helix transcriptional regulator [Phycisphaerales bacterium]|nr:helix-turn-helix transcriptional regulator [Phycisphaerales bacterium]